VGSTTDFASVQVRGLDRNGYCKWSSLPIQGQINVGKTVDLAGVNCNVNPSVSFSGNWGTLDNLAQCSLTDPLQVPSGGSCVPGSTTAKGTKKTCYQTVHNGCYTTYCPVDTRTVNATCTQFLDTNGATVTSTPAGCQ
jgi:hypothetical protein